MKNTKYRLGIAAIGFCFISMSMRVSAEDLPKSVWPSLSSAQYYWYEPQTGLTIEQADAIFKEVATEISLVMSRYPKHTCIVRGAQSAIKKPRKGKTADNGSIKLETEWAGYSKLSPISMLLNDIQKIDLYYVSKVKNKWLLSISGNNDSYELFFKDEKPARKFGDAVVSLLTQQGLSLKLSKLGLFTIDLTPEQAAELGKTRIDNVLITLVAIDGPADKVNIQPLDVITEVNGVKVKNASHFTSLIDDVTSGTRMTIACLRRTEVDDKGQKQSVWKPNAFEVTVK